MRELIDTHSHIYDTAFDDDRDKVIEAAKERGVSHILLPAIDSQSHHSMAELTVAYPGYCLAMMGLHPTSVNDNPRYIEELEVVERLLANPSLVGIDRFCGVGEVGLDLYWSTQWEAEQQQALRFQIELALKHDLPLAIHTRNAWTAMREVLSDYKGRGVRGVMHSFSGSYDDYKAIKECGDFLFGIGGVVTYKRSEIAELLPRMELGDIVLETDSPYLPPVPYRGKRNESSYISLICDKVAEIYGVTPDEAARTTTLSAKRMFGLL